MNTQETIGQPEGGVAVASSDLLCPVKFTKIVSFSFGQTSGYMLRKLMDANPQTFDDDFCVVFANTGREHEATLDFGHEVETRWGVPIVWLEYCRENEAHSQKVVDYETAARRNAPGPFDAWLTVTKTLPNVRSRGCSSDLKTRIIKRWLKSIGVEHYEDYVGIRSDEAHRKLEILAQMPKYITGKFPLCDDGTTKETVNKWWDAHDFRLNIPNHQGNCDMCFLKAKWKRLSIAQREPQHAQWWADWERKMRERGVTGRGAQWIAGQSYEGIIAASQHPEFDFSEQDVPCSCAVGGYRDADDEGHNVHIQPHEGRAGCG
jgi:3'-phosphoadenosine 5'-phosphosulfate sulfotransferase (PAPS reductase)/FAD synthetase